MCGRRIALLKKPPDRWPDGRDEKESRFVCFHSVRVRYLLTEARTVIQDRRSKDNCHERAKKSLTATAQDDHTKFYMLYEAAGAEESNNKRTARSLTVKRRTQSFHSLYFSLCVSSEGRRARESEL